MNTEALKQQVEQGLHLDPDAQVRLPRDQQDSVYAYLDMIRYGLIYEAGSWLEDDFQKAFGPLTVDEQAGLAEADRFLPGSWKTCAP